MVMLKTSRHMYYMSHVTHVTCHKYQVEDNVTLDPMCYIFLESWWEMQFNGHAKNVTCHICYMSHVTNVTWHKYKVVIKFPIDPMCYIFLESWWKIQFNGHAKNVTCHMSQMLLVTNIRFQIMLPNTPCVIYFWKADEKPS